MCCVKCNCCELEYIVSVVLSWYTRCSLGEHSNGENSVNSRGPKCEKKVMNMVPNTQSLVAWGTVNWEQRLMWPRVLYGWSIKGPTQTRVECVISYWGDVLGHSRMVRKWEWPEEVGHLGWVGPWWHLALDDFLFPFCYCSELGHWLCHSLPLWRTDTLDTMSQKNSSHLLSCLLFGQEWEVGLVLELVSVPREWDTSCWSYLETRAFFFLFFNWISTPRSPQACPRITFHLCLPISRGQSVCFHKNHMVTYLVIFACFTLCF